MTAKGTRKNYPVTPDGHFFVSKGRLWRCTDPSLDDTTQRTAVKALMQARRAVRDARDEASTRAARRKVQAAKEVLGERGPVWWSDGSPDEGGKHPRNSIYAAWWASLDAQMQGKGDPT